MDLKQYNNRRPDRLSRDTSVSSDTSTVSTTDSEAPFLPHYSPISPRPALPGSVVALVVVCLLFSVGSVFVSALLLSGLVHPPAPTPSSPPMCVSCHALVTTPFPDQDLELRQLERHFHNNTMFCCASTPTQLALMVTKMVRRGVAENTVEAETKADEIAFREHEKHTTPARAFLLFDPANIGPGSHVREWISERSPAYLLGFHLSSGRLVVQHAGIYLIYSQIYFKVNGERSDTLMLGHKVSRYSVAIPNGGTEHLLQAAHTCCKKGEGGSSPVFHTSYVAGVFRLAPRDEVYVTVSDISHVYSHADRSYFGVMRLQG